MKTLKSFITESKNTHVQHIEDRVLYGGVSGTREAINALRALRDMLSGSASSSYNVTVKYDGAPAVFCGYVPQGEVNEGKFFVAKKGLFNKAPKYYTTPQEVDADTSGDLAAKLKVCLKELPKVVPEGSDIFQGDLMFTASDLKKQDIDGQTFFTFHPNTIMYAVPANTPEGKEVKAARMGIVFHTRYRGKTFADMRASFDVRKAEFKKSRSVWLQDAHIKDQSGRVTLTKAETDEITAVISDAGRIFQRISSSTIKEIESTPSLAQTIETFNNTFVRSGTAITDTAKHTDRLIQYIRDKYQKEIDARKTAAGKDKQQKELDRFLSFFSPTNKANLKMMFDLQNALVNAKLLIMRKLNNLMTSKTFIKTRNGYKVVSHEGFVAVDHLSNGAVKLVDRLEFSHSNFSPDVIKGWEKS